MTKHVSTPGFPPSDPESLAELRGDCARMAPRWTSAASAAPAASGASDPAAPPGGSGPGPRGVRVPARSARLLDGMSDYGD